MTRTFFFLADHVNEWRETRALLWGAYLRRATLLRRALLHRAFLRLPMNGFTRPALVAFLPRAFFPREAIPMRRALLRRVFFPRALLRRALLRFDTCALFIIYD